jgi:primosomal protein N' (replication factor Y) (superfamily II helicase)
VHSFVEVAFPLPLHQTFTYEVPKGFDPIEIGHRVLVPFGKRTLTGYVVGRADSAPNVETKEVCAALDDIPILTPDLISLIRKMSRMYGVAFGEAIATAIPPGLTRQSRRKIVAIDRDGTPNHPEQKTIFLRLKKSKGLDYVTLVRKTPSLVRILNTMEREGWITVDSVLKKERARESKRKRKEEESSFQSAPQVRLTDEQQFACSTIGDALRGQTFKSFLLHGITGSGKTEVYLQMSAETLKSGRTVLALVPEISLTPQFVGRFKARFGEGVAVLHSARSESARLIDWKRILRNEVNIVIGARSAVFAPLKNIGLVIVDEEHDHSYKQEDGVHYNACDLARIRAEEERSVLLFGSATPSLETFESVQRFEVTRLELSSRATGQELASVEIVDLRQEFSKWGEKGLFSERLRQAIEETLDRKEQAVLFLNRRGFAPTVFCPSCGSTVRCPNCSVSLTYHERDRNHLCHYCGYSQPSDLACPTCSQPKLIPLGIGTERIEQEIQFRFPDARILRMDRDTVRKKGKHETILASLAKGETDILVGTQMVTKGIDLPNVTLVGVLLADQSLHFPDFRSAERTFQLLTQVVGRSGRGTKKGRAIIQTFQPEHYAIVAGAEQDYAKFYAQEIGYRKELRYPPFSSLSLIEISGKDPEKVRQYSTWLAQQAHKGNKDREIDFMGPTPALIAKVNGRSRFQMLVRSPRGPKSAAFSRWLVSTAEKPLEENDLQIELNIDPYQFL